MFAKNSKLIQPGRTRTTGSANAAGTPLVVVSLIVDQLSVPREGVLRRAALSLVVHVHETEAGCIALGPLEVVEQRPDEVAAHVHPGVHGFAHGPQVPVEEIDALGVVDEAV